MILVASHYQILSVMIATIHNTISKKLLTLNFYLELQHSLDFTSNEEQIFLSIYQKKKKKIFLFIGIAMMNTKQRLH